MQARLRRPLRHVALAVALVSVSVAGCSNNSDDQAADPSKPAGTIALSVADADRCDPLDPRSCLLPFPSDAFTVADSSTATGRRVAFDPASMPANAEKVTMDPTDWNRADGFSPGSVILTQVPGIDLGRTGAAPLTDIGASLSADAPIVVLDTQTGERAPYWAELDANAADDTDRLVMITPATQLTEGHRYAVALRNIKDAAGQDLAPTDTFRAYRDNLISTDAAVEARRDDMNAMFDALANAGVERDGLMLAWQFTVASADSLSGRMLTIRDDAFATLGSDTAVPAFTVDDVQDAPAEDTSRRIVGTFQVPLYLSDAGEPGSTFNLGDDGKPTRNDTTPSFTANYVCNVSTTTLGTRATPQPARAVVYGHGLLGGADEVNAGNIRAMSKDHNTLYCATDWIGMAEADVPNAAAILSDMGKFPSLADRVQQGMLNTLFLGRLLKSDGGFATHPAFQLNGQPLFATGEVFFDGNSQGGIIGGAVTAVSTEWTRAVLGVPAMNYSILLNRSKDFEPFLPIFYKAYPNQLDQLLTLGLVQMLWDRGETAGYAQHLTDSPLPGTPAHQVLMHVAYGDHQVSTFAAAIEARTIGARLHTPALADGRRGTEWWGLEPFDGTDGSGVVVWDSGAAEPPLTNTPPEVGDDPHSDPRSSPVARQQKSDFLQRDGTLTDVCNAQPCTAPPR
jgi:hypothetical protein